MKTHFRFFPILSLALLCASLAVAQESREVQKSGPFSRDGRLSVDTYKGSVTVTPWDKDEIRITARIESDGHSRREREQVEDTEVRIDLTSSSAHIKTDYDRVNRRRGGFLGIFGDNESNLPFVHYTINVPRTTNVRIKDYKSTTSIEGLQSDVEVETYKGEVRVAKLAGSMNLQTYKGEAHVEFAGLSGRSRAETYKGEIEFTLPRGKGFDLDADLGKRASFRSDFDLDRDRGRERRRGYDVRTSVNGGGPLLRIKSERGEVRLIER